MQTSNRPKSAPGGSYGKMTGGNDQRKKLLTNSRSNIFLTRRKKFLRVDRKPSKMDKRLTGNNVEFRLQNLEQSLQTNC